MTGVLVATKNKPGLAVLGTHKKGPLHPLTFIGGLGLGFYC